MKFLNVLKNLFLISNKHNINDGTVKASEVLTRYLFSRKDFNSKGVKAVAFIPSPNNETSVFRTLNLGDIKIWEIGVKYVERLRKTKQLIKARADFQASVAFKQNLSVIAETSTHKLHANIISWPQGDDDHNKSLQKLKAAEIARHSTLHIRPKN